MSEADVGPAFIALDAGMRDAWVKLTEAQAAADETWATVDEQDRFRVRYAEASRVS